LPSFRLAFLSVLVVPAALALTGGAARAQSCMTLQYELQPDCYRADVNSQCVQSASHMDLGPQIAVWIQDSTGKFVDTLMVTNATSVRGIGNRPGRWDFLSGPLFPYGKRAMALPIWAHARGKTYSTVMMQEQTCAVGGPAESCLGWHESFSSPERYFCRPLQQGETQNALGSTVDAITCATSFNSEKGVLDATTVSYYPPRSDLTTFTSLDTADPPTYATINDLDAVAAATPLYGTIYHGTWSVPGTLPPGDYTLMVEVNKEFDTNASHTHPDYDDSHLPGYGTDGNFGQPSVVYAVPLHIDVTAASKDAEAASQITGYGDWTGMTGVINPRDATISTAPPGSGEARLLTISNDAGTLTGRVVASVAPCSTLVCDPVTNICSICDPNQQDCMPLECSPPPAPPSAVTGLNLQAGQLTGTSAAFQFVNAQSNGAPVMKYDIRYQTGKTITDAQFGSAASAPQVMPGAPGTLATFSISNLKPSTDYVVAVRAIDPCGQVSTTVSLTFTTPSVAFTKLSGCFVATTA